MIREFLTVFVVLALGIGDVSSAAVFKDVPGCTAPEVDECGFDFVPFFGTTRLAETAEELEHQCKLFKAQLQCVETFVTKCLQGIPKVLIYITIKAARYMYDGICNTITAKHREYLDGIRCINKAGTAVQTSMKDFFVALHRAATAPVNKQIAYTCCYHGDFVENTEKALTSQCNLPGAIKFFNAIMDKVVGNGLSFACSKYEKGPGACEALPALCTKNDTYAFGKGFIEPAIVIINNLGEAFNQ